MKRRGLIIFLILSLAVFAGLAFYGDLPELVGQVSSFPIGYWFIALGLALANYLLRLVRWQYYLRVLGIRASLGASTAIFLSGLSMAISPGRLGELAKSYFLKDKFDVPVARSAAVVVAERITDLLSVLLLSLWGLTLIPYGWAVAMAVLAAFGTFALLVISPWGSARLFRLPLPGRWRPFLSISRDALHSIFSLKPLMIAMMLGVAAWLAEGCALWLVLRGLGASASLGQAVSIYGVATLLGAVTMLPGGLVATEGGLIALLQQVDIAKTPASTATFIIRVCTLWFAVLIGLLALVFVQVYLPRKAGEGVEPLSLRPEETPGRTV